MFRSLTIILLGITSLASAGIPDSLLRKLSKEADYIALVSIPYQKLNDIPVLFHDLGNRQYHVNFQVQEVLSSNVSFQPSYFNWNYSGYENPDTFFLRPGMRVLVFLKNNPGQSPAGLELTGNHIYEWTGHLEKKLHRILYPTRFDRAVYRENWSKVERIIRHKGRQIKRRYGADTQLAIAELSQWLGNHSSVKRLFFDCFDHIAIYPGWVDMGIRFAGKKSHSVYRLTYQTGKVRRCSWLLHSLGFPMDRNRIYFRNFLPDSRYEASSDKYCRERKIRHLTYTYKTDPIQLRIYPAADSFAGSLPQIRVKLVLTNHSGSAETVIWPVLQNNGFKNIHFRLYALHEEIMIGEDSVVAMPRRESAGPDRVLLQPGDSLVTWHTINAPHSYNSDIRAYHHLEVHKPGDYLLAAVYRPEADGEGYWIPPGGIQMAYAPVLNHFAEKNPADTVSCRAEVVSTRIECSDERGIRSVIPVLVRITEKAVQNGPQVGDTLALVAPYRWPEYSEGFEEQGRPMADIDRVQSGDKIRLILDRTVAAGIMVPGNFRIWFLVNRESGLIIETQH
jgi:hypothetical protein